MENEIKTIEEQGEEKSILDDAELKSVIEEQFSNISNQYMVVGFRVACKAVLDKIYAFERMPGNKSNNDHKRLIKNIKQFVEQGLARKFDENDAVETTESETAQN